jgi:hypothetical protein
VFTYLNDENPGPAVQASDAIHQRDRSSQQSTERTCERCSREEQRSTETKLRALVPAREVVVDTLCNVSILKMQWNRKCDHTWEEAGFCQTKKESASQKSRVVLDQSHCSDCQLVFLHHVRSCDDLGVHTQCHDQTPEQDNTSEEHAGCKTLQHDVGGRLSQAVRDKEDRERIVVVVRTGHFQISLQPSETRVADVCAI